MTHHDADDNPFALADLPAPEASGDPLDIQEEPATQPRPDLEAAQLAARKLAPPPKPMRESRPSLAPGDATAGPSIAAPRAPMITLGEVSQPVQREAAQAWTRPSSEPPRPGSLPPRPGLASSSGGLRPQVELRERVPPPESALLPPSLAAPLSAVRESSAARDTPVSPSAPVHRPTAPPFMLAVDKSAPSVKPLDARAPGPKLAEPKLAEPKLAEPRLAEPKLAEPKLAEPKLAEPKPELRPVAKPLAPAKPTPADARSSELKASSEPEPPVKAVPSAPDAARPKSEPARLREGSPRRSSNPGLAAVRPASVPPRPAAAAGPQAQPPRVEVPPAPKLPQFGAGAPSLAHVRSAGAPDDVAQRRSEPPVGPSAIDAMKNIAVGDPSSEIEVAISDEFEEQEDAAAAEGPAAVAPAPEPVSGPAASAAPLRSEDQLEELAEEDVAPDVERRTPLPDLRRAEPPAPLAAEPISEGPQSAPLSRESDVKPPPPPPRRQQQKTPSAPKSLPQAKRRQKRAWWEDLFGEDFVRASFRLSESQIRREVDFIEESLGVATGGVVLDLACGSGSHAVELASRGYGVVGYDLSLYQLALAADIAQERAQRLNFLQGDMREMAFDEMFDGIFCWNTSFGYFEEDKNLHVAERVFRALRPGGMFLIDVVNRDFVAAQSPCQLWYEGDSCVCMDDMSLDFITSRMRVKRSVILDDGRTRECLYSIRVYSLHELGKLLHDVGFRVTEASGHAATPGVFFGEHSPRIIMLAQKP